MLTPGVVHYCTLSLSDNWVSIQRLSRWVTNYNTVHTVLYSVIYLLSLSV